MENLKDPSEIDICNSEFKTIKLPLKDDWQGEVNATLIYRLSKSDNKSKKAVLYIHGFIDYFFHWEMADFFNELGFDFFAIDLRKYGRSLMQHQKPNIINSLSDYYEELDLAVNIIRDDFEINNILLKGHSTGGLIASLYAQDRANLIKMLILNSPFFQFNAPFWKRQLMLPFIKLMKIISPEMGLNSLTEVYPKSLHKDYYGEWDFNLKWKPIENFPAFIMWLNAIRNGQKRAQEGLSLEMPILVLYSDKSFKKSNYDAAANISDAVLDVKHIAKYAKGMGSFVDEIEISDGMHDLVLSLKPVREKVYSELKNWISNNWTE